MLLYVGKLTEHLKSRSTPPSPYSTIEPWVSKGGGGVSLVLFCQNCPRGPVWPGHLYSGPAATLVCWQAARPSASLLFYYGTNLKRYDSFEGELDTYHKQHADESEANLIQIYSLQLLLRPGPKNQSRGKFPWKGEFILMEYMGQLTYPSYFVLVDFNKFLFHYIFWCWKIL